MARSENSFEFVRVNKEAAMKIPAHVYFNECGVSAYSCPIPQSPDMAKIVHFVSGADGNEFGQYPTQERAKDVAASVVHGLRRSTAKRAVQILHEKGYTSEASDDGRSVSIMDPVTCRSGSRCWVEYTPRKVYVDQGFSLLFNFISERS